MAGRMVVIELRGDGIIIARGNGGVQVRASFRREVAFADVEGEIDQGVVFVLRQRHVADQPADRLLRLGEIALQEVENLVAADLVADLQVVGRSDQVTNTDRRVAGDVAIDRPVRAFFLDHRREQLLAGAESSVAGLRFSNALIDFHPRRQLRRRHRRGAQGHHAGRQRPCRLAPVLASVAAVTPPGPLRPVALLHPPHQCFELALAAPARLVPGFRMAVAAREGAAAG